MLYKVLLALYPDRLGLFTTQAEAERKPPIEILQVLVAVVHECQPVFIELMINQAPFDVSRGAGWIQLYGLCVFDQGQAVPLAVEEGIPRSL